MPRRPYTAIVAAKPDCRRPHEQAPGWHRVVFAEHSCAKCGTTARSWRPITCGESGHECKHAPWALSEDVEAVLWTLTIALREPLTEGLVWPYPGFAHPLDVTNTWACSCGHQLAAGREITWETTGVRLFSSDQPTLF